MSAPTDDSILVLRAVTRTFVMGEVEVPVLRGVDLEIPRRRLTVILGPSGSGKTTLLNLIGGIDRPSSGAVLFDGLDLAGLSARALTRYRRDSVGFVFQFYNLVPTLTAIENVMVSAELTDEPVDPRQALEVVELGHRVDHFPAQLSGGEQQRVAVARALAKNPRLLLCDEPTGAVDLRTGRRVLGLLRKVADDLGKTVIVVTHNMAIAEMADRLVRVGSGVIEEVRDNPQPRAAEEISW
ncbi:MAG: ABC transporter ATP-binding protein [Planctomycetota bacterium]